MLEAVEKLGGREVPMSIGQGVVSPSFAAFLKVKWLVLVPLILLYAYVYFLGMIPLNVARSVLLTALGIIHVLIFMFLWFRFGRIAWFLAVVFLIVQFISRRVAGM